MIIAIELALLQHGIVASPPLENSEYLGKIMDWNVVRFETRCGAFVELEGNTRFVIEQDFEYPKIFTTKIANKAWSIVDRKSYQGVRYKFDNRTWSGAESFGDVEEDFNGLVPDWKIGIKDDLRYARTLEISLDGKFIDRIKIENIGIAVSQIEACIGKQQASKDEAARIKAINEFPADPFASDKK